MARFSLTVNFVHQGKDGANFLAAAREAYERGRPVVIDGLSYRVAHIDIGALVVQRAPSDNITSILLVPSAPNGQDASYSPLPLLQELVTPEDGS